MFVTNFRILFVIPWQSIPSSWKYFCNVGTEKFPPLPDAIWIIVAFKIQCRQSPLYIGAYIQYILLYMVKCPFTDYSARPVVYYTCIAFHQPTRRAGVVYWANVQHQYVTLMVESKRVIRGQSWWCCMIKNCKVHFICPTSIRRRNGHVHSKFQSFLAHECRKCDREIEPFATTTFQVTNHSQMNECIKTFAAEYRQDSGTNNTPGWFDNSNHHNQWFNCSFIVLRIRRVILGINISLAYMLLGRNYIRHHYLPWLTIIGENNNTFEPLKSQKSRHTSDLQQKDLTLPRRTI